MGLRTVDSELSKTDLKTLLITLGCILGAGMSGYLLYRDITNLGVRSGTPLAQLERFQHHVRLKPASSFVWGNAGKDEKFYLKDSVQTASGGDASIRFTDGTLLELGENSLIVIDSIDNLSLNFLHGSATVHSQNGDRQITLDKDGKASVERLPVHLISPEPLTEFFISTPTKVVDFSWAKNSRETAAEPDAIQIAPDRHFRAGQIHEVPVSPGATQLKSELAPGEYYWRVTAHGQPLTAPSRFEVESAVALRPLFPTQSQEVPLYGDASTVQFRWTPVDEESDRVERAIEISTDPGFGSILRTQEIASDSGSANVPGLKPGEAYWRIVNKYPGLTLKSPVQQFKLKKVTGIALEQLKPEENAVVELGQPARFSWSADSNGLDYRLQVRSNETETISAHSKVQQWSAQKPGVYQWRVQAVYNEQVVGESGWRAFSASMGEPISLISPASHQEIVYWTESPLFSFKWSPLQQASSYLVEVASDAEFKNVVSAETTESELSSAAVTGKLGAKLGNEVVSPRFWRVKGLDAAKHVINFSSVGEFTYGVHPLLRAPASAKPDPGAVINVLQSEKSPVISWTPVENAQGYELSVKQGDQVVFQQNVAETQIEMKDLKPGKYQFTVRAIDERQRRGEPLPDHSFEITYGDPLGAPEALSPEVQ